MYRPYKLLAWAILSLLIGMASSHAQTFQIAPTEIDLVVAPGFNHANVRVPITGTASGFDFTTLSVQSDASWVTPTVDSATHEVVLAFKTSALE